MQQSLYILNNACKIVFSLIIPAYILIATFTPDWAALDKNAPGFLALSVLNLLVFIAFVCNGYFGKKPEHVGVFFNNPVGWIYSAFILIALIGAFLSANRMESILQWSKIITIYIAVFNISMILMEGAVSIKRITLFMTGMLFFDACVFFPQRYLLFTGQIESLLEITFVYSNKNIFAAAVFIKLPFAMWLVLFETAWKKWLGYVAFAGGVGTVLLLGARTFYLGLMILLMVFLFLRLVLYFRNSGDRFLKSSSLRSGTVFAGILILGISCFWFFSESIEIRPSYEISRHLMSAEKIKTASLRLDSWQWSFTLIRENPWFGVGIGNWKSAVLEYENQKNPGFVYLCRAHNDFLETMAETGVLGGLLFICLCLAVIYQFCCSYFDQASGSGSRFKYHFLAAAGIFCYSVDALFNFPADRPEIMILFAVFVSIAVTADFIRKKNVGHQTDGKIEAAIFITKWGFHVKAGVILLLTGTCWVLFLNFQSSKTQRIVYQEIHSGRLTQTAKAITKGFPFMPNISLWGEPVAVLKARYLIHEEQFEEAINTLLNDISSPYDSRREFFLAMAFYHMGKHETALRFSEAALQLKPNFFENLLMTVLLLESTEDYLQASRYCDTYLANNALEKRAWILTANLHIQNNALKKAGQVIDRALTYFPKEQELLLQRKYVRNKTHSEIKMVAPDPSRNVAF